MDPAVYAERRVGTTLRDKWTLEKLLGVGGMAAVYVGVHRIGQRAAIKILHPEVARSPELRARFEQEAHAVNRFVHPGVVEVRDIDVTEDGAPFLVMELLEGTSLADRADGGTVERGEVLRLADELLDVLVAAHARGIVHRDIKPDNLFVTREGRLKVLDFGIARVKDGMAALHTRTGAMLGTAPYMAPEQIRGVDIDARVDVFAVGATMFRLLARRRVHEVRGEAEMLVLMATVPAPPLVSVAPDVPPEVGRVVDRALAFDRDQRYPDAASMQRDVQALRAGVPPPSSGEAAPPERTAAAVPAALAAAAAAPAIVVAPVLSAAPAAPLERTVAVPVQVPTPTASNVEQARRDETKTALIVVLGLVLFAMLAVVVALLARPAANKDSAASDTPPSADSVDPSASNVSGATPVDEDRPLPPRPGWDKPKKGKGHGHGKGKHHERDDDE
jgi:serine/threonine-protein kinase